MQDAILRPTMCEETKQKWFLLSWHLIFDVFILFLLDIIYLGDAFLCFSTILSIDFFWNNYSINTIHQTINSIFVFIYMVIMTISF